MTVALPARERTLTLVYYCSGHGYGHATRVSAFARHLLSLQRRLTICIVSSAPKHVFSDSIAAGALYRNADIDPVIVQPLAYRVDRQKSVEVLQQFLTQKDNKVRDESQWLQAIRADCVLSDAAFLGCLAANEAGVPSVLITNFSFDSVYSYLSTSFLDGPAKPENSVVNATLSPPTLKTAEELEPDTPIPFSTMVPLVDQIHSGYRCADLLLRLPGTIPLPSFSAYPSLPSPEWVDMERRTFKSAIVGHLTQPTSSYKLLPQIPFPPHFPPKPLSRQVVPAPLLVRSPHSAVYTPEGRSCFLDSIGIPAHLHDPNGTKILIVSFGGQVFHKPNSRSHSRTSSKASTPVIVHTQPTGISPDPTDAGNSHSPPSPPEPEPGLDAAALKHALHAVHTPPRESCVGASLSRAASLDAHDRPRTLRIPGAPPAAIQASPRSATFSSFPSIPSFQAVMIAPTPTRSTLLESPSTPTELGSFQAEEPLGDEDVRILPDESWIAVVCGVPKDWGTEGGEELPEGFFVAPRDVYMPDLTAVADVLLGKLGYGTVSECVDACTPFVFVPRPLFIEEHGLRLYLDQEGAGVELSRTQYEVGEWAEAIERAYQLGKDAKARKRVVGETGQRAEEGRNMAQSLVDWVDRWHEGISPPAPADTLSLDSDERELPT
ncbi:uncharacterized protein BXZ73DRAFT_86604 [Epithele typhae]|uniref:uncharacterized protein n=1 Tax=Epithele typhae TaxID=378194 RepID=UPI002008578B|nr:uncharacterized protein BXZ73DRAFT_86604 [Epithele typhae]KAH9945028.1 hypothetical protein BXZ73DRAFT_86604 [Epithele typhae]